MPEPQVLASTTPSLHEETPYRWRIEPHGAMRVPGIVFASRALLPAVHADRSLEQVVNVATLPGVVTASYAMPDVHWGYGFPIGGASAWGSGRLERALSGSPMWRPERSARNARLLLTERSRERSFVRADTRLSG